MTMGLVRLAGDGSRGVGLGLIRRWDYFEDKDALILKYWMGDVETYSGDDAKRIVGWLREHSDIPIIARE